MKDLFEHWPRVLRRLKATVHANFNVGPYNFEAGIMKAFYLTRGVIGVLIL